MNAYTFPPVASIIPSWSWWDNAFTDSELDYLQDLAKNVDKQATTGRSAKPIDLRRSNVDWMVYDSSTKIIFDKLAYIINQINSEIYNFNITGFYEPLQLTNYLCENLGTYDWHQDYNAYVSRKLSMVVQLSDPSEYEGGELEIFTSEPKVTIQKKRGYIAIFPSYIVHRVTPVTKGSRQSLVTWVSGPKFK
jgi:PKHD-type hydroxylase